MRGTSLDAVAQVVIPALGALTVALLSRQRRAGYVIGLASQPFWLATAWLHRQWGVLVSSAICALAFADGLWRTHRPLGRQDGTDARG